MNGSRKRFDQDLADWAKRAERHVRILLMECGYTYTELPKGKFDVDGFAENDIERFYVEVERRSPLTWKSFEFPYDPVRVPERRGDHGKETLIFTVRADLSKAIVIFPASLFQSRLEEVENRYVEKGELLFHVPLRETLPIDLTGTVCKMPLAWQNAKRVRDEFNAATLPEGMRLAHGEVLPYGMAIEEWNKMQDAAESRLEEILFGDFSRSKYRLVGPF